MVFGFFFSPLKDVSHLSRISLISSRNLSPGLATAERLLVTVRPGALHHSKNHSKNACM